MKLQSMKGLRVKILAILTQWMSVCLIHLFWKIQRRISALLQICIGYISFPISHYSFACSRTVLPSIYKWNFEPEVLLASIFHTPSVPSCLSPIDSRAFKSDQQIVYFQDKYCKTSFTNRKISVLVQKVFIDI